MVPSFQDWEFPHGRIPDWPLPRHLVSSGRCGITNMSIPIDEAYLIPQEEELWFVHQGISRYAESRQDIDDQYNILPLRVDIHKYFDKRLFVIVPKPTSSGLQYTTHVLSNVAAEIWPEHHNILVNSLDPAAQPFLFARFAWAIIFSVKAFITAGTPRHVVRLHTSSDPQKGEIFRQYKSERLSGPELYKAYGGGGAKTAGPAPKGSKRSRIEGVDDDSDHDSSDFDSDIVMGAAWDYMQEWDARSRRRLQLTSETTAPALENKDPSPEMTSGITTAMETTDLSKSPS